MYREVYTEEGTMSTPAGKIVLVQSDVTDPHRVMAYVDSSKTKVAGAEGRMQLGNRPIESINMGDKDPNSVFPNFEDSHSAQFVWRLQKTWKLWETLEDKLDK